eukprot:447590-Prymnesium_polylepis.1
MATNEKLIGFGEGAAPPKLKPDEFFGTLTSIYSRTAVSFGCDHQVITPLGAGRGSAGPSSSSVT